MYVYQVFLHFDILTVCIMYGEGENQKMYNKGNSPVKIMTRPRPSLGSW